MTHPTVKAALAAILLVAACTPAATTPTATPGPAAPASASPAGPASPPAETPLPSADAATPIVVRDFELDPATLDVTGSTVALAVRNEGPTVHNVTVRDDAGTVLLASRDLREGETETVTATLAPGTYVMFCSLPGHESLGMAGSLTVAAP